MTEGPRHLITIAFHVASAVVQGSEDIGYITSDGWLFCNTNNHSGCKGTEKFEVSGASIASFRIKDLKKHSTGNKLSSSRLKLQTFLYLCAT